MVGELSIESGATDYSPLKRGLSQQRETPIHTIRTKPVRKGCGRHLMSTLFEKPRREQ